MTAPDLTKLTADELRNLAIDFERNWTDRARALCELHRRAQANDRLRSLISWALGEGDSDFPIPPSDDAPWFYWRFELRRRFNAIDNALLSAAPAAPPTPAAPVTDAEIEAAIDDLCEAAYGFEASGCDPKSEAARVERDKQHALVALIARRVAGDQDAKLRQLRAMLVDFCRIRDRGYDVRSDFSPLWVLDEIDRLLAAPAASQGGA